MAAVEMQQPHTQNSFQDAPDPTVATVQTSEGRGVEVFGGLDEVLVTQQFNLSEVFGIEAKNRYRISPVNNPHETFLYAQESSDGCERVCCSPCRSLTMNIHQGSDKTGATKLSFEKKFVCPMLPWPVLLHVPAWFIFCPWMAMASKVGPQFVVRSGSSVIGTVTDPPGPLFCCKANSIISDASGNKILECGPNSLCDYGMCCPCMADEVVPIFAVDSHTQVATITRKALSCEEMFGKMNRFTVNFGTIADPETRALIFAAAMLFDLTYWEQK